MPGSFLTRRRFTATLMGAGGALLIAVVLVNRLGAYAYPVHRPTVASLAVEAATS